MAAPLQDTVQVRGRGGKHSPTGVPEPETSTHRESLTRPRTVEQPQSLLHQSWPWLAGSCRGGMHSLHPSVEGRDEPAP